MKTKLHTEFTIEQICKGFVYNTQGLVWTERQLGYPA